MNELRERRKAQLEQRTQRWRQLLSETGADKIAGEVRTDLLIWRSGSGRNSVIVDTMPHTPLVLSEAIWRLNEDFDVIMSIEGAPVHVPAPIPPSLGGTLYPGIDVAGLFVWDGFFNAQEDTWDGLLWECYPWRSTDRPLIKGAIELRRAIDVARKTGVAR